MTATNGPREAQSKRRTNSATGLLARVAGILGLCVLASCGAGDAPKFKTEVEVTPAEDSIGERLFLDTRFAQYFATHTHGSEPAAGRGRSRGATGKHQQWGVAGTVRGPVDQLPLLPFRH